MIGTGRTGNLQFGPLGISCRMEGVSGMTGGESGMGRAGVSGMVSGGTDQVTTAHVPIATCRLQWGDSRMIDGGASMIPGASRMIDRDASMIPGESRMIGGDVGMTPGPWSVWRDLSGMIEGESGTNRDDPVWISALVTRRDGKAEGRRK